MFRDLQIYMLRWVRGKVVELPLRAHRREDLGTHLDDLLTDLLERLDLAEVDYGAGLADHPSGRLIQDRGVGHAKLVDGCAGRLHGAVAVRRGAGV